MYKLFDAEKFNKFWMILEKMDRHNSKIYVDPNRKSLGEPEKVCFKCAREVFVERTVKKWFRQKYLILFEKGYKKYLFISNINYALTYGTELSITYFDYTKLDDYNSQKFSFNALRELEGVWCEDSSKHEKLLEMLKMDFPILKFKCKVHNTDLLKNLPENPREGDFDKYLSEYLFVEAMTINEATEKINKAVKAEPKYYIRSEVELA